VQLHLQYHHQDHNREIKESLSMLILEEQFGFLEGHSVMIFISTTHETLHTIKVKKKSTFVVKISLSKEDDKSSLIFLGIILLQVGSRASFIQWVMG